MNTKKLLLGTAQWGWTVSATEAYRMLDAWIAAGHRAVDAATNYPINKKPADFRAAENILREYVHAHGLRDLEITMKIGSMDNMRSPDANLAPSFVLMMAEEYRRLFGENLRILMLHWDNREAISDIQATLSALAAAQRYLGLRPGISGIKNPDAYVRANQDLCLDFDIQLKHNVLHSDLARYTALSSENNRRFAYGINAGGLKIEGPYPTDSTYLARGGDPEKSAVALERIRTLLPVWSTAFVRPPVRTLNHLGLIFAGLNPHLDGIVLGFSKTSQLAETLDFWRNLNMFDYADIYNALVKIAS